MCLHGGQKTMLPSTAAPEDAEPEQHLCDLLFMSLLQESTFQDAVEQQRWQDCNAAPFSQMRCSYGPGRILPVQGLH